MPTASTDAATAASAPFLPARESAAAPIPTANQPAALPALVRDLPESGHRLKLAPLPETADSLALSQLALSARASRRTLAIVCADALATAFFVGGLDLARRYCAEHCDVVAIVTPDESARRPLVFGRSDGVSVEVVR